MRPKITSLKIKGYRLFEDITLELDALQVLVGANGSGKSALLEFLRFLRDSIVQGIPPEVVKGTLGQEIFRHADNPRFWWSIAFNLEQPYPLWYQGEVQGPIGRQSVTFEQVKTAPPHPQRPLVYLKKQDQTYIVRNEQGAHEAQSDYELSLRPNQLALGVIHNPNQRVLNALRAAIESWRFYSAFGIDHAKIRQPTYIEQAPVLEEDGRNLSAVLFYLQTEFPQEFQRLQTILRSTVPGFQRIGVKARGGPGQVIGMWQETGSDRELTLADISDGTLRMLCWAVIALQPNPPALIGIDEPDQGLHPRTLDILADLLHIASAKAQIIVTTHQSYFLTRFALDEMIVMRKRDGRAEVLRPESSQIIRDTLADFGINELENMHRSDQLEII